MMAYCGAVVSGSNALQFFDRVYWRESNMNVYFNDNVDEYAEHAERMGTYLIDTEGYEFVPNLEMGQVALLKDASVSSIRRYQMPEFQEIYTNYHIRSVFTFTKETDDGAKQIQLIPCYYWSPPLRCILDFHSTIVMNFFTWNKVLFEVSEKRLHSGTQSWKVFSMVGSDVEKQKKATSNDPFKTRRYLNDRYCWTMEFDTTGISPTTALETISDFSSFGLYGYTIENPASWLRCIEEVRESVTQIYKERGVFETWDCSPTGYPDKQGGYIVPSALYEKTLEHLAMDQLLYKPEVSWDDEIGKWWKGFVALVEERIENDRRGWTVRKVEEWDDESGRWLKSYFALEWNEHSTRVGENGRRISCKVPTYSFLTANIST
ncbi:hypothetical protein K440DRAFT_669960 [Wilcoxina mikolae CBS 423.85]|nr:hypothetical protein K440DRAFT_669960 [Wilcoxina mikolae CBS 423.85]